MINFLIYHHSQKYSFTRRPNTQLYMQFACYRKQKIKKFINPQSRQQQNASPSPSPKSAQPPTSPTPQNTTTSQQPPVTTTKNSFKKKPEGCAEGPWPYGPFAVFIFPQKRIYRLINKYSFSVFFWTHLFKLCKKFNNFLVVFTIKKVYHIKINYKQ